MATKGKKIIAIDFDGVIYEEGAYPFVGEPIPKAIDTINKYYNQGHTIIIWTCREGEAAEEAILALERDGAKYHFFNNNDHNRIAQYNNDSRKIGCDIYIDDKSLNFLVNGVDWDDIATMINYVLND